MANVISFSLFQIDLNMLFLLYLKTYNYNFSSSPRLHDSSADDDDKSCVVPKTFMIDDFHYTGLSDGEKADASSRANSSVATIRYVAVLIQLKLLSLDN